MSTVLVCWKCGAALPGLEARFARTELCPACNADLHVCRLCEHYDRSVSRHCREPVADPVRDETRANFCGYFSARPGAHEAGHGGEATAARSQLDALFGIDEGDAAAGPVSGEAQQARDALDALFGLGDKRED